jgi:hypothetical protein
MVWEDFLTAVAPSLNVTAAQAGIILSFVFTIVFIIAVALAAPDYAGIGIPTTSLFSVLFFTYVAWLPSWTGTALSFILAWITALAFKNALQS